MGINIDTKNLRQLASKSNSIKNDISNINNNASAFA